MIFDPFLTRLFLIEAFNEMELHRLCQHHFRDVFERFTPIMTKGEKVQVLLDHCERYGRMPQLLAVLENTRPVQYKQRFHLQV